MIESIPSCPSEPDWKRWLEQDRFPDERCSQQEVQNEDRYLAHLNECASCRKRVERLSEQDPFFHESRSVLRSAVQSAADQAGVSQDLKVATVGEDSVQAIATKADVESSSAMVAVVQSLLGPTDEESALGRIGRFLVTGIIGGGGMGIVLKARSLDVDRIVAIKIPQPQYWQASGTLLTIEREARSAASVVHPNVISIYHVDRYRDVPYLVMPYLPGETLEQRIRKQGRLEIDSVLRILRQVASALAAAHACGVIHRDVKPANILLVGGTDRAVLSDFGLAKVQSDASCTATGTFAGTPIYLSPEQASGRPVGPASDVFSLGTVLWTMLAGQPPMLGMHTHAMIHRISKTGVPSLPSERANPSWMLRLMNRMHDPEPESRPDAEWLASLVEQCERHHRRPASESLPTELRSHTRLVTSRIRWGLVWVALLLIGATSWFTIRNLRRADPVRRTTTRPLETGPTAKQRDSGASDNARFAAAPAPMQLESESVDTEEIRLRQMADELDHIRSESLPRWESQLNTLEEGSS
ncbi:MAG: serine/threonine-protein kinase [Planctomycetota bacterium]